MNINAGAERKIYGDEFGHFFLCLGMLKITNREEIAFRTSGL
jgi:hypothetical protein